MDGLESRVAAVQYPEGGLVAGMGLGIALGHVAYRYRVSQGDPMETVRKITSLAEHEAAFARERAGGPDGDS
ncbi:MAG: hypothetical protein V5A62_10050 [Haloarculaceae archaeon]